MRRVRELPSFTVLLTIVSLVVLVPLCTFGYVRWNETNDRYEAALSVQESAQRLQLLLQLAPAVGQEELSTVWVDQQGDAIFEGIDVGGAELLLPDFGATVENDRAGVDELLAKLDGRTITDALLTVRADGAAGRIGFFEYAGRYAEVVTLVEEEFGRELRRLTDSVDSAGASEVIQAARVSEAAASLQIITAGQATRWGQLHAAELFSPVLDDSIQFANSVAVFNERIANLELVARPGSSVGQRWIEVRSHRSTRDLRERYEATVRRFAAIGVDPTVEHTQSPTPNDQDLIVVLRIATDVRAGFADGAEFSQGLGQVVELSLHELDRSADRTVSSANGARRSILIWSLLFLVLIIGVEIALVLTVGRPIRRMAYSAQQLSRGHLNHHLRETGPTEVRLGARALNEAIESIHLAKEQAMALADERLDDEILERTAPGQLGTSLHAAVKRLGESIEERDRFQRQLEHDALHDHLTHLPNRAAILRQLDAALARTAHEGSTMALLFLDIDNFKTINDTYGHHTGDEVLRTVAHRLSSTTRTDDLAGRLGGDEFVVVAEPVKDIDAALALSDKVLSTVNQPITVSGVTFYPSVSIGIGIANKLSQVTSDELLRDADSAVYRAKLKGKSRVEVCDDELRVALKTRDSLEASIRRAIDDDQLVLHYQPSVHATTHEIVGVEALVRWNQPDGGLVYPDGFIPAAERTDLILDIDRWVLNAALSQLGQWSSEGILNELDISVNISARRLGAGTLCAEVCSATERYGVDSTRLILELTETALLDDIAVAARELAMLRDLGLRIALDDFGTGFMSLAHLRQLPVDILKIDRSFVNEIDSRADQSLLTLIVDTGHLLDMSVVAEGVETREQAHALRQLSVDHLQGFYFSKPRPAAEIARMATEQQIRLRRGAA